MVDMTKVNDDEVIENSEEEQARKVTYLCPVSDCVFVCQTMENNTADQHLQSSHAGILFVGQKFIKL